MRLFTSFHLPIGTIAIVATCAIIFVASLFFSLIFSHGVNQINQYFAIGSWQYIQQNSLSIYTLITSIFFHANFTHIAFNMLALLFMGSFLEGIIGTKRFLQVFFITGIVGGLAFLLETSITGGISFALGASGAIFGISGALMILRPNVPVVVFPLPIPMPLWIAILLNLVVLYVLSFVLPIANSAHIGGLVAGLALGYLIKSSEQKKYEVKIEWTV